MQSSAPDLKLCNAVFPDLCFHASQQFAIWEVLLTAVISALTILASIWLARWTTRNEIARERAADRTERRQQMIITFTDYGISLTRTFRDEVPAPEAELVRFASRMFAYVSADDQEVFTWMNTVVREIIAAGSEYLNPIHGRAVAKDAGLTPEEITDAFKQASAAATMVLRDRVFELNGWVRADLSWKEYARTMNIKPFATGLNDESSPEKA